MFGITTNILFLSTSSIILPWALHCGWNLNRFGSGIIVISEPTKRILEYQTFNLLEGSTGVLLLSGIVTVVALYIAKYKKKYDTD